MDRTGELGSESVRKLLLKFSIPAIIGMIVNALYNIVDKMFIGRIGQGVGEKALTGVGFTMPISTIIMAFGMLVGVGASTIVSIRLGEKNKKSAEDILGQAFLLTIIVSIGVSILGLIFLDPILRAFGAEGESLLYAKEYISIILAGSVLQNIGFGLNGIIRSEGNPKIAMRTMLVGAFVNTILDPIFIFDSGLGLGVKGAAIATVISQGINTILVLHYFLSKNSNSILKLKKHNIKLSKKISSKIFAIGLSPFSMQIAASAVSILYTKGLKTYGGDMAVGAMSIISGIATLIFMPIFGINQGVQPILGYNYGAKNYERVKIALKQAIIGGICIASLGFILVQVFPNLLLIAFGEVTPQLIKIGSRGIRIDLMFLPIVGYQIVAANYFQAVGKANISIFLSFLRQVIVLIPVILILPRFLKLDGLWLSQPIADIAAALITSLFLYKEIKSMNHLQKYKENKKEVI